MKTNTSSRLALGAALTGTAAVISLAGAGAASAQSYTAVPLSPGQASCVSQYASYQVRADGTATAGGARFKVLYNGRIIQDTAGRVSGWAAENRSSFGNFPGPGYYSVCAYNTGTSNTTVTLRIRTDSEF
jgi:hypothetical protein